MLPCNAVLSLPQYVHLNPCGCKDCDDECMSTPQTKYIYIYVYVYMYVWWPPLPVTFLDSEFHADDSKPVSTKFPLYPES